MDMPSSPQQVNMSRSTNEVQVNMSRNTNEVQVNMSRRPNEVQVKALLIITYICLGLYQYIPGPTFIDLAYCIHEDLVTMPLLLAARAVGYIVAYIAGTFLFHRFLNTSQKPLLFFLMVFLMSVTAYSVSICTTLTTLSLTFFAAGVCFAAIETGANAFYLLVFGQLDYLYFQSLHLFYGTGAFIAPLIARNYITEQVNITDTRNSRGIWREQNIGSFYLSESAYVIVSAMLFSVSILWLANYCCRSTDNKIENSIVKEGEELNSSYKNLIIFISSILKFFMNAVDFSYTQVLPVYCVIALRLTPRESADVLLLFLGCYTTGRLLSTIVAIKVCSHSMLSLAVVLIFCGGIFLFLNKYSLSYLRYTYFLVGNSLIGLGAGPMHPALMDWLCHKMYMSHRNVGPIFVMGALSDLVVPALFSEYLWLRFFTVADIVLGVTGILFVLLVIQYVLFFVRYAKRLYHPTRLQSIPRLASVICPPRNERPPLLQQPLPAIVRVKQDEPSDAGALMDRLCDARYRIRVQTSDVINLLQNLDYRNASSTDISIVKKSAESNETSKVPSSSPVENVIDVVVEESDQSNKDTSTNRIRQTSTSNT